MYEKRHVYEKRPFQTYVGLFCRSLSYVHITLVCAPLQKRPTHVWKETSIYIKRNLNICTLKKSSASSRTITLACAHLQKRPAYIWKETYKYMKRDPWYYYLMRRSCVTWKMTYKMYEKRPAYVWKETYDIYTPCVDRASREQCNDIYKSV